MAKAKDTLADQTPQEAAQATPQQTIERLAAELAAAKKELETFKAQAAQASADEIIIREKMSHGLTRDQAVSVIHRQRAHDAAEKAQNQG
jgi:hypothetical protein